MIKHPFGALYDSESKILILGSFPSVKSREEMFFYGHPQNRFWQVLAEILGEDVPQSIEEKKIFLKKSHIALWDVLAMCDIEGSADSSIRHAMPNDISHIIKSAPIEMIFLNGKAAQKYFNMYIRDGIDKDVVCLPSTSPANAAWSKERLVTEWKVIKKYL